MNIQTILEKAQNAVRKEKFDAIVAFGPDNAQYLSGANLPFSYYRRDQVFAVVIPAEGQPLLICPGEWESAVREIGNVKKILTYRASTQDAAAAVSLLKSALGELAGGRPVIGFDRMKTARQIEILLAEALPSVAWKDCSALLDDLRMVKDADEVALLEWLADETDHAINGAIHHVTVDRRTTALTMAEELRVHSQERGVDLIGYHAAARVAGDQKDIVAMWHNAPRFGYSRTDDFIPGDVVRMEIKNSLHGYWADAARIMVLGDPTPEQREAYGWLVFLREAALRFIQPGKKCCEVYRLVKAEADKAGIPWVAQIGLGHGIGVAPVEPPFLADGDETVLRENMILVLEPVIQTDQGAVLYAKDTVLVTPSGCRLLGWYKDWREPYIPIPSI